MWLFKKDMYQYNLFERVKIDFIKEQQNSKVKVEKVCDNDKYIFYKYTPDDVLHYTYIVGQLKKNPKKIYYFGENFEYVCEFKGSLFLCNNSGEINRPQTFIHRLDLNNKTEECYNLRGDYSRMIFINGYGRAYSTDHYIDMKIENEELAIYGQREKGDNKNQDDVYNCDMNFKIVFRIENNNFVPYFITAEKEFRFCKN